MDDLVEVATFSFLHEAAVLESILQKEGISYYLKNEGLSQSLPVNCMGGIGLIVNAIDAPKTIELLKRDGFGQYLKSFV